MEDFTTQTIEVEVKIREDIDNFILEYIYPWAKEADERILSKEDLRAAISLWVGYKSGAIQIDSPLPKKKTRWEKWLEKHKRSEIICLSTSCTECPLHPICKTYGGEDAEQAAYNKYLDEEVDEA